ncbi:MAG TPA: hypothetical protein VMQ58_02475, partial [Candidatus Saccharimonadales bacterium]|nr:hypothetical protein [Candidatus Saccharimonadales bacterium]
MTIKRRTTKRKVTTKKKLVRRKSTKSKVRKCPTCGGLTRVSIKRKAKGKWDDDPKDTDDKEDDLENIRDYPIKKAIRE